MNEGATTYDITSSITNATSIGASANVVGAPGPVGPTGPVGAPGVVQSVTAGTNVTVTGTTANPIINSTGGGGGAVASVFGRSGTVTAQTGDYTPTQVGADASGAAATAQSNAESFATSAVATETSRAEAAEALALQKTNNLNDVSNTGNARQNIHVPSLLPAACVASTNVSTLSGLNTYDGYTLTAGDQVLLTTQTTASQNGPWVAAVGSWTRPTDFSTGNSVKARTISIIQGTLYGETTFLLQTNGTIIVDTTAQTWVQQAYGTPVSIDGGNATSSATKTVDGGSA